MAVKEWQTKPGRAELRQLSIYDRAIRIMNQNAPGFSPVWEKAVKESEDEIVSADTGMSSMLRRAFRPLAMLGNGTKTDKPTGQPYDEPFEYRHHARLSARRLLRFARLHRRTWSPSELSCPALSASVWPIRLNDSPSL